MRSDLFKREGTSPVDVPEPFGSALAFLSDLHEQVEVQEAHMENANLVTVLVQLRKCIEGAGLVVMIMGGAGAAPKE
jgi:hypothetical protein